MRRLRVFERTGHGRWRLATAGAVLLLIIILIAVLFAWRRRNMPRSVMPPTGMLTPSVSRVAARSALEHE